MEVTFNDLKKISQLEIFKYAGFSLVRNKAGDYVFYKATEPTPNSNMPDISNESTLRKLSPILSGFQVIFMLKTPGTILKTNADRKSNNASIWSFDFDKDPKSILKLQKTKFVTIFSSSGLDLPEIRVNNM